MKFGTGIRILLRIDHNENISIGGCLNIYFPTNIKSKKMIFRSEIENTMSPGVYFDRVQQTDGK